MESTGDCCLDDKVKKSNEHHSGLSKNGPVNDPKDNVIKKVVMNGREQEYLCPVGKPDRSGSYSEDSQFIVYDVDQVKMRYLI